MDSPNAHNMLNSPLIPQGQQNNARLDAHQSNIHLHSTLAINTEEAPQRLRAKLGKLRVSGSQRVVTCLMRWNAAMLFLEPFPLYQYF